MKSGARQGLVIIGFFWLVIIVILSIFHCPPKCAKVLGGWACGGCDTLSELMMILVLGIPSWILFLIATLSEKKSKKINRT